MANNIQNTDNTPELQSPFDQLREVDTDGKGRVLELRTTFDGKEKSLIRYTYDEEGNMVETCDIQPQLGRSTGRARLASRVAAAAGPPGARAPLAAQTDTGSRGE